MSPVVTATCPLTTQPIRRLLQTNVCILMCLSGITFAAAEGHPLALISVPAALLGLMLTDRREQFALPTVWANLLGLAAFIAAGYEFFGPSVEGRLLGFGHLLCYLAWILLLQPKKTAQFWWLCALSVLQIATSSVLTNDYWFPLVAMCYVMLALWTLSVFSLDRAVARAAGVEHSVRTAASNGSAADSGRSDLLASEFHPLAASQSRNTVRLESQARWITPRFVVGILGCGMLSILVGIAIFVLTPRIWVGSLRLFNDSLSETARPITGFAEEVQLGDIGEILENPNIVLEAAFFDHQTDARLDLEETMLRLGYDAPVFRGTVLENYSNGRWSAAQLYTQRESPRPKSRDDLLRQEIHLRPTGSATLFAADRASSCVTEQADVEINHDYLRDTFVANPRRRRGGLRGGFTYTAFSKLTHGGPRPVRLWRDLGKQRQYHSLMRALPSRLERLRELAWELAQRGDGTEMSPGDIAGKMLRHLRESGTYSYSLNVSINDPLIDPVEDFLFNRREGHCEYFASALALMLRAVDIPSRLVSGFKGGTLNEESGRFEVRQLHAHAWVEAYIDERWVVLDPTPASRDASIAQISTNVNPLENLQQFLEAWWVRGLFMNQRQQQTAIYQPLGEFVRGRLESIRRVGVLQSVVEWFRELGRNPQEWISGRGFVTVFVLGLIVSALVWMLKWMSRLVRSISITRRHGNRRQKKIISFYERFRRLVARQGYVREEASTHSEFASNIEQHWLHHDSIDGLARLPTRLADAFYRVRFGEELLSDDELRDIDASLGRLEQWMARHDSSRSR